MTLSQAPTFFLEAPAFPARRASRMRIHWFDYAFFTLALIGICGGALFLLELGSAQSSGQGSFFARFMEEAAVWLPVVSQKLTTYGLLFLASVVNSAVMVLFVQVLRTMDRTFSRSRQRRWPASNRVTTRPNSSNVQMVCKQPAPALSRDAFLLSPIIR
jgi:hypothetical protein